MKPYDEELEIANYVWQHYRGLFTPSEVGAYGVYYRERMNTATGRDVVALLENHPLADELEVKALLADGAEAFYRRAARQVVERNRDVVFLNRCPRCDRLVRTPKAQQCLWCGHDWHAAKPVALEYDAASARSASRARNITAFTAAFVVGPWTFAGTLWVVFLIVRRSGRVPEPAWVVATLVVSLAFGLAVGAALFVFRLVRGPKRW